MGPRDRLTLRDVVRLGTFNCRTLLSEVRQQELVRLMESQQIDVLAIYEHRMVLLDPNEMPTGAGQCGKANLFSYCERRRRIGDDKKLMDLAQRRETWRRLSKSL